MIGNNQHGFSKRKSCLTNIAAFYDGFTALVYKERMSDISTWSCASHLTLSRTKSLSLNWRGTDWLGGHLQRVVVNGSKSKWRSVMGGVPQELVWEPVLFFGSHRDSAIECTLSEFANTTKL